MLATIIGTLCIAGGLGWLVTTLMAGGMASRHLTAWESIWIPGMGFVPVSIGIFIMMWG